MTEPTGDVPGRIFVSYRRDDTAYPAGWLYERLTEHFGKDQVFKDIDSIPLGDDFAERITSAVESCDVLLALIGDRWLTVVGEDGRRRLDDPGDFVRLEIGAALTRNVRVIPILLGGARIPGTEELPASLAKLAGRQAFELSSSRFDLDAQQLLRKLDREIAEAQEQARQEAERAERHRQQVELLQGQIRDRAAAQDWDAVLAASDELAVLDAAAADPDGLASLAREQIARRRPGVTNPPSEVAAPDDGHYQMVADEAGNLVIFLGAAVNTDDREGPYRPGSGMLPDDTDLANYLLFGSGAKREQQDLAEIAQYVSTLRGDFRLFRMVNEVLKVDAEPSTVHKYLARFPNRFEELGLRKRYPMIVTSQLDVALERAFLEQGEPFDAAIYMSHGTEYAGKFMHLPWSETEPRPIIKPDEYMAFPIQNDDSELMRTVIVRFNGAIEDPSVGYRWENNLVITEDHYGELIGSRPAEAVVPGQILEKLRDASVLFLGYTPADRQHRSLLRWIWPEQPSGATQWAVERNPDLLERQFCLRSGIALYRSRLADYLKGFDEFLLRHRETLI
jgi:hypothetical protein